MKPLLVCTLFSIGFALVGCQTVASSASLASNDKRIQTQQNNALSSILTAHTWSYNAAQSTKPIVLSFQADRFNVNAGCNVIGGAWTLENDIFHPKQMMSTMMACDESIMRQEQFAGQLFSEKLNLSIENQQSKQPTLIITTKAGKQYRFVGQETHETKYQGQAKTIFLEIQPELKECMGVIAQKCMQVREIQYDQQGLKTSVGNWQLFYNAIEGYEHNTNTRTIVRVKRFDIPNAAADQSKYAYVHDLTVEYELLKP